MSAASAVELSMALTGNPVTEPLLSGQVEVEGVRYTPIDMHPSEMFWRQFAFGHFDVSELSVSSLMIAIDRGDRTWTALPVFPARRFFHNQILVRADSGIESPADLVGKRVGVPEYQQTGAVWVRGALQHEFGVRPDHLRWFMERPLERSHGGTMGFAPPPGVELEHIATHTNIGQMLRDGELDATVMYLRDRNLVDRSSADLSADARIRPLFADPAAEGFRYHRKTGLLPVNHCVVVRTELLRRHPWLALNLYDAFLEAKQAARRNLARMLGPYGTLEATAGFLAAAETDPLPYGVREQRGVLRTLTEYSHEQGLTSRVLPLEEIFAADTLEL
jgi:4,5-dihydroxyphthalate decarboxylase